MTTKEIEHIAYKHFTKTGIYSLFECAIPRAIQDKYHRERIDYLIYESTGIWRAIEIKVTYADFHSKCALSWIGNFNYYLIPSELYQKVKDEIPDGIGCYIAYQTSRGGYLECVKKSKHRELLCSHEDMMNSFMQGLSREYKKYRKILEKQDKVKSKKQR